MDRPCCGKCGGTMTPEDSRIHPEYFLHDRCLPEELRPKATVEPEVELDWQEFWLPIVRRPDGLIDMEQVKRELFDFHMVMRHCERIYDYASCGRISKCQTVPEEVIAIAEQIRREEIDEAVKDAIEVHEANNAIDAADEAAAQRRRDECIGRNPPPKWLGEAVGPVNERDDPEDFM